MRAFDYSGLHGHLSDDDVTGLGVLYRSRHRRVTVRHEVQIYKRTGWGSCPELISEVTTDSNPGLRVDSPDDRSFFSFLADQFQVWRVQRTGQTNLLMAQVPIEYEDSSYHTGAYSVLLPDREGEAFFEYLPYSNPFEFVPDSFSVTLYRDNYLRAPGGFFLRTQDNGYCFPDDVRLASMSVVRDVLHAHGAELNPNAYTKTHDVDAGEYEADPERPYLSTLYRHVVNGRPMRAGRYVESNDLLCPFCSHYDFRIQLHEYEEYEFFECDSCQVSGDRFGFVKHLIDDGATIDVMQSPNNRREQVSSETSAPFSYFLQWLCCDKRLVSGF